MGFVCFEASPSTLTFFVLYIQKTVFWVPGCTITFKKCLNCYFSQKLCLLYELRGTCLNLFITAVGKCYFYQRGGKPRSDCEDPDEQLLDVPRPVCEPLSPPLCISAVSNADNLNASNIQCDSP